MSGNSTSGEYRFYHYTPSLAAAIIFIVLFAIASVLHTFIMFKRRAWFFVPFVIGCIAETIGYVGRALGHFNPENMSEYILQITLILIAPAFMAASLYMVFGRLILLLDADHLSLIRSSWLTKFFVFGDVFSLIIQAGAAGMSGNEDKANLAKNIILVGLFIQIAFFGLFVVCTAILHTRILRRPTTMSLSLHDGTVGGGWKGVLYTLYFASIIIFIRSIFRVIEFAQGEDGALQSKEVYTYIFDAVLMTIVVFFVAWRHPNKVVRGRKEIAQMRSANKETEFTQLPSEQMA